MSRFGCSQAKLVHGIQLVIARNYIENLREEVKKGMREKAAQGVYPARPPIGYRHNQTEKKVEVIPEKAAIVRRMFELHATGCYSLDELRKVCSGAGGFRWLQPSQVQETRLCFRRTADLRHDDCMVTAEFKKEKYTYYRCTGYRGKCNLPRMKEAELGQRLGKVLQDIYIPDDVLTQLQASLVRDDREAQAVTKAQHERLDKRLTDLRSRIDQAYTDKLDGKIAEDFWQRKTADWQREEQQIMSAITSLSAPNPERILTA